MTNKTSRRAIANIFIFIFCLLVPLWAQAGARPATDAPTVPGTSFKLAKIESWMLPEDEYEAYSTRRHTGKREVQNNKFEFFCGVKQHEDADTLEGIAVSFYNPNEFAVMLNNFVSVTFESGQTQPQYPQRYLNVLLSPKRDFKINCDSIGRLFFPESNENFTGVLSFRGAIYSKSMRYLDIILKYTGFALPDRPVSPAFPIDKNL